MKLFLHTVAFFFVLFISLYAAEKPFFCADDSEILFCSSTPASTVFHISFEPFTEETGLQLSNINSKESPTFSRKKITAIRPFFKRLSAKKTNKHSFHLQI